MKPFSKPQLEHCEESGFEQQPPSIDLCVPSIVGEPLSVTDDFVSAVSTDY